MAETKTSVVTGTSGKSYTVTHPVNATDEEILMYAQSQFGRVDQEGDEGGDTARSVARGAGMAAKGFTDSALGAVGALPDLVASGLRYVGLPAPADPNFYTRNLKEGYAALGEALASPLNLNLGPSEPQTGTEKLLYEGGRGAGTAASFMVPAAAVANTAKTGSTLQGVANVMRSQPVTQLGAGATAGTVTEATDSPLAGLTSAVLYPSAANLARRAVTPFQPKTASPRDEVVKIADEAGINLTPAQRSDGVIGRALEAAFAQLPTTAGRQRKIFEHQRKQLNTQIMKTAGVNADDASPETLAKAFDDIGAEFQKLIAKSNMTVDAKFFDDVEKVAQAYARRLPTDVKAPFQSYIDDIMAMKAAFKDVSKPSGNKLPAKPGQSAGPSGKIKIDGKAYQTIASDLRAAARRTKNPDLNNALRGIANSVDDLLGRNVPERLMNNWRDLRNRYRNLTIIDDAKRAGTAKDRATGDIPLAGLTSAVRKADPRGFARGKGEINRLRRVGDLISASRVPDSGTTQRLYYGGLLSGGAPAAVYGDPLLAAGGLAAGLGGPRVAQEAYLAASPIVQKLRNTGYGRNQILPQREINRGLLGAILAERSPEFGERALDRLLP